MKILIAFDGSECSVAALADLKRAGLPPKSEAHIFSVFAEWMPAPTSYGMVETRFTSYLEEEAKETLAMARRARTALKTLFPDWEIDAEALRGSPAGLIVDRAAALNADLIVVGSHGRSALGRVFLGSVSQKVLHAAHCAVRIARGREEDPARPIRIIIGIDGSEGAVGAVDAVAARHWPHGSEAKIVSGFPAIPYFGEDSTAIAIAEWIADERGRVDQAIEAATGKLKGAGLTVSTSLKQEDARRSLINEAQSWDADCIFVGARGMGAVERFLMGSVSSYVATHASCSVEVIREA